MAVNLKHNRDTSFSSQFQYHDVLSQHHNNKKSYLRALLNSTEVQKKEKEEDLIAEVSHQMDHFMLQDDDKFHFSGNDSHNLELSWDLIGSPQSTLGSNQGSSKGSTPTSQEPSSPTTPCWKSSSHEMMKLEESDTSKYHHGYEIQTSNTNKSIIHPFSHQSLIQEQIRAIELCKVKQEHVVAVKKKQSVDREREVEISRKQYKKKEKAVGNGHKSCGPPCNAPMAEGGDGMRVIFLGGSGSTIGGTGVFFPRCNATPSESISKNHGKGCATVLIPSRVVQALQLHFDKMSSMSGSKPGAFPPLHDILVKVRDGIYSVQKQQSQKVPANIMQNETILPQEWTY